MLRTRIFLLLALVCGTLISLAHAQKNAAEEKREAERIKNAEQALTKAKSEYNAAEKKFKAALQDWRAAEQRVVKAKAAIDRARDDAEQKLEDSTGLPKAAKAYDAAKQNFAKVAEPIRADYRLSPEYLVAKTAAEEAFAERDHLRNVVTGLEGAELTKRLGELNKAIRLPEELEQAAILQKPAGKKAFDEMLAAQKEAAAIRAKIQDRIDNEANVKRAQAEIADAQRDEQQAERAFGAARSAALKEQQQALAAQKNLADAKAADRRDDAQDNKKKNNNKKK